MPRVAWNHLVIALIALPLVSCFQDVGECPTCPGVNSGRIEVRVPQTGLIDSIYVWLNSSSRVIVRRNRSHTFENLSSGTHDVAITRWFYIDEALTSRSSSLQVRLDRGEARVIKFHNDFPLVAWTPTPDAAPIAGRREHRPNAQRTG